MTDPAAHLRITQASHHLRDGRLVAFPTETVYGLGADSFSPSAVARVFAAKGRPGNNPLIVHVSGPEMARRVTADWSDDADALARAFWPGPLSIILPRADALPAAVTAGGAGVAVRCPDHPVALALLFEFGGPLVGPSANRSGALSPTTAAHVRESFPDENEVFILDGGPTSCRVGIESTVLSLLHGRAEILRPGAISTDDLAGVLGRPVALHAGPLARSAAAPNLAALPAPGMHERHYAPAAPLHMFDDAGWPAVLSDPALRQARVAVLTHRARAVPPPNTLIPMPVDAEGYAARLYAALREADALKPVRIYIERPPALSPPESGSLWAAIHDRLRRASTPPITPPAAPGASG